MHVLIIGLSSIVQRRVLPALAILPAVERVDIASRSKPAPANWRKAGSFFSDYTDALAKSGADLVYISLPNSDHLAWITASLAAGKHVIVDKPATLTLSDTQRCAEEATKRSRLLAEATVFSYHPQIAAIREFFDKQGPLTHIDARFIIPPLPNENFRNYRELGGGCLQDMGPYAAAVARLFTRAPLRTLQAYSAPASTKLDIDVGFSVLAHFEDGLRYSGHFSFESEYQNKLALIGAHGSIAIERVFSPPPDMTCILQTRSNNVVREEVQAPCDVFRAFVEAVLTAVEARQHDRFAQDMLVDAQFRGALAASLGYGEMT